MVYIPGDYLMICDRCGAQYRRSQMQEEWTGLWVCTKYCWTPRHPQDFVEAVTDDPSVPVSRPSVVQSMGEADILNALGADAYENIFIVALSGLADKDPIGITMDNGIVHWTFINGDPTVLSSSPLKDADDEYVYDDDGELVLTADTESGYYLTLHTPVWYAVSFLNKVYLPSINNESWI